MRQKGLSVRLNSHVTSIAIVIIALVVYINYHFSKEILVGKIEEGAINQSNLIISKISRVTVGSEEVARNVSYQALYYYQHNDLEMFLGKVLETNQILESIHVDLLDAQQHFLKFTANKPGQRICNPDSLSVEKYFRKLIEEDRLKNTGEWSSPFYCKYDTTHLLVSYRIPIFKGEEKRIAGFVSCDVSLRKMQNVLSEIKIGETGYAFIIDNSGKIITHPKQEWILRKSIFEKPTIIFKDNHNEIEAMLRNGGRGAGYGSSQFLDQKSWFYFAPIVSSNWMVIIVVPEKELLKEIEIIFQKMIFVSGIGILLLFLFNMFIFRRTLDPLVRITHAIQRFSSISGKESTSKNEIMMLAESLEDWQMKYGLLIHEQTKTANEKLKYEKDLNSAREIQSNIVPSGNPIFSEHPEIDLFAVLKPAEIVGGDLYDYFFIDKNHLLIAMGDVSGKGIPASLFMAIASTLIKSNAKILSSKDIVSLVNKELSERNSNQYFVTLFVGILDIRSGVMDYCNAAHNYPYILRPDGTLLTLTESHGLPLGIYKEKEYKNSTLELYPGDMIIAYTDGVINSKDTNNQHYGIDRLEANVSNLGGLSSEEVVSRLLKSVVVFEGENRQADDITIMALKFTDKTENQA